MGITDWTLAFNLTSKPYSNNPIPGSVAPDPLPINQTITFVGGDLGIYRLRPDGCNLTNTVRETKDFVPQADGAILHRRFVGGMEMTLAVQMWQPNDMIACDELLGEMVDGLEGYLYGLLNAGDNEGRISWAIPSGGNTRMLDDIRLLSYPAETQGPGSPLEITFSIDCQLPYAEDLTQLSPALPGNVVNNGNRPTYPVWEIHGPYDGFTLTLTATGQQIVYDGTRPGAFSVGPAQYVEIDTFRNTTTLNGSVVDYSAAIDPIYSDFFTIPPGTWAMGLTFTAGGVGNASSHALINAAWQ